MNQKAMYEIGDRVTVNPARPERWTKGLREWITGREGRIVTIRDNSLLYREPVYVVQFEVAYDSGRAGDTLKDKWQVLAGDITP